MTPCDDEPGAGAPTFPRPSVDDLRRVVQAAVHAHSLRGVAAEVGMTAPGLQHFLDGGRPLAPTRRKLTAWYVQRVPSPRDHVPAAAACAALALLVDGLPPEGQGEAGRELLEVLRRQYARFRMEPPAWTGLQR